MNAWWPPTWEGGAVSVAPREAMKPLLDIKELEAGYGKLQILQAVALHAAEGEVLGIIGANGAGKTTVLKAVMNMVDVMAGEIHFRGMKLNEKPWYKIAQLGIAFVPQKREIFAPLTVRENLEVGSYRVRRKKAEIKRNLDKALEFFPHLTGKLGVRGGVLSGGEQKMLSIARGLMGSPELLLLDEPSLGLAPALAESLFDNIACITRQHPTLKATVIVEQNAFLALGIANRAYVLEGGKVVLSGPSEDLLANEHVKAAYLSA